MSPTRIDYTARPAAGQFKRFLVPAGAVLVAGLLLTWASGSGYRQDLIVMVAVYALIALGMYVPFVLAGSMSMAYGAYAAVGGYSLAIILTKTDLPAIVGWIVGPIIAAIIAVVLGLLTRRLSGFFLAAATLLFSMAFEPWLIEARDLTGGSVGIGGIPLINIFGWSPPRLMQVAGALLLLIVATLLVERIRKGSWGVTARAMRDVPAAVEAMGVRTATLTTVAQAVGALVAALGGAVFVTFMMSITPETFTLHIVFLALFMPIIGGQVSAWGAAIGAMIVVQLTLNMPGFGASGQLILAIAVLLILLIAPGGVIGYVQKLVQFVGNKRKAVQHHAE
ncbi:branched-chain amino acid ABC transporter permease [Glaciibacter psychrotolerans]|uniref:Branched-chain amino acid transport system permease protein n=1 Tax=Glaciibacter psychrotolerans TaxID=670054 RepID=A0A7Z0EF92_9MICO|nr:branched-chain amino acid ABC transporter permease [Leifsonia psychrotolerans]NYJ20445.1 branched-chain amino acid transport system permease protein [Leifsonia psychrotolerans]